MSRQLTEPERHEVAIEQSSDLGAHEAAEFESSAMPLNDAVWSHAKEVASSALHHLRDAGFGPATPLEESMVSIELALNAMEKLHRNATIRHLQRAEVSFKRFREEMQSEPPQIDKMAYHAFEWSLTQSEKCLDRALTLALRAAIKKEVTTIPLARVALEDAVMHAIVGMRRLDSIER